MKNWHRINSTAVRSRASILESGCLLAVPVADTIADLARYSEERFLMGLADFEVLLDRCRRIYCRRPGVYLDFTSGKIRRRNGQDVEMPKTLAINILEFLFRNPNIHLDDFHLLPRGKRPLGTSREGKLNNSFSKEICALRRFLNDNNLPIEIIYLAGQSAYHKVIRCDVRSNIHDAQELAECGQHRLSLGDAVSAAIFADRALTIDPDCRLAAILAVRTARICPGREDLYKVVVRGQNQLTRSVLRLASGVSGLGSSHRKDTLSQSIVHKAHQKVTMLGLYLRSTWHWNNLCGLDKSSYVWALYLMAQCALEVFRASNISSSEAFSLLLNIPTIAEMLTDFSDRASDRNAEQIVGEVRFRFWRLLLIDAWLPDTLDIHTYAEALKQAIKNRFRVSNTPDGAGRTNGLSYCDNLLYDEDKQVNDPFDAFE